MKKIFLLLLIATGTFATVTVSAQKKETLTSKTATKSKGYSVLNPGEEITIYKYVHRAHSPKEAEKYAPKYFFTTRSSDVLMELTKYNLKKSFPDNHAFHDALDATFKQDSELTTYDSFHKMYKLTWLLKNNKM